MQVTMAQSVALLQNAHLELEGMNLVRAIMGADNRETVNRFRERLIEWANRPEVANRLAVA